MSELSYHSPETIARRSWIRTLLLLAVASPLLVIAVALPILGIAAIVDGPSHPPTAGDIFVEIFLWCCCTALASLLLKRADPYRTLPASAPGEASPRFTRLASVSLALAILAVFLAASTGTARSMLLRYAYFHHRLSFPTAMRIAVAFVFLLVAAAATCALIDIISATASPIRRRGYGFACLALALLYSVLFVMVASVQHANQISSNALRDRHREIETIESVAISRYTNPNPPSDPRYIFPALTSTELADLSSHGALPAFDLILVIRPDPLPAVASGTYLPEGILVCFANDHARVTSPADWPRIWAAHNAARASLALPPQPDPFAR